MLSQRKSTPLVCNWRTRPNSSQGIPAKASGLNISMAAIRPTRSAIVSQKMADKSQLRAALCSVVKTPLGVAKTSWKSLLMRAPCRALGSWALVRNDAPGQGDRPDGRQPGDRQGQQGRGARVAGLQGQREGDPGRDGFHAARLALPAIPDRKGR